MEEIINLKTVYKEISVVCDIICKQKSRYKFDIFLLQKMFGPNAKTKIVMNFDYEFRSWVCNPEKQSIIYLKWQ